MVHRYRFDFYPKSIFLRIIEETAPGGGVSGKDDGAFSRIVSDEQAVFACG